MAKLIVKIVVMLALMAGMSNYLMLIMTGKSPLSSLDFSLPSFSFKEVPSEIGDLKDDIKSIVPGDIGEKQTIYKWVDANGVTQYTSEPPPEGHEAKTLELDPNTNIVQSFKAPPKPEDPAPKTEQETAPAIPGNAQQLIKDAKKVQQMLDERNEKQQKLLENL